MGTFPLADDDLGVVVLITDEDDPEATYAELTGAPPACLIDGDQLPDDLDGQIDAVARASAGTVVTFRGTGTADAPTTVAAHADTVIVARRADGQLVYQMPVSPIVAMA